MSWLGLDIGGANLKLADANGSVISRYFPLWQERARLANALADMLAAVPTPAGLAVTMTGELADCYATKSEGVADILQAAVAAGSGVPIRVYAVDGSFLSVDESRDRPHEVAASNWVAMANFLRRHIGTGHSLVVDVGSTTTDIVVADRERLWTNSRTDAQRLAAGELVYTGVLRSPLCAVVSKLPWQGQLCRVAQELFATTADAYVTLGHLDESAEATVTADGRGLTRQLARDRLARSICCDRTTFSATDALAVARAVRDAQVVELAAASRQVLSRCPTHPTQAIVSGSGEFLARIVLGQVLPQASVVSYTELIGARASVAAPAYALAVLANEAFL